MALPARVLVAAVALAACQSDDPDSASPSGTPATGTPGGTPTGGVVAPEVGHLVHWAEDLGEEGRNQHLIAVFARHFDGLAAPAPCAAFGHLCVTELPATDDSWIDATPTTYDAFEDQVSWVGHTMEVGGNQLRFNVDPTSGFGAYDAEVDLELTAPLDVSLAGEWGAWSGQAIAPVGRWIDDLRPEAGSLLISNDGIAMTWEPAAVPSTIYVRMTSADADRIWRFADDGEAAIPASELQSAGLDDRASYDVYRVARTAQHDVNGHTLTTETWAMGGYRTARSDFPFSCKAIHLADPDAPSGVYTLQPDPLLPPVDAWCDMDTDGGGWTLVSASTVPVDDLAEGWHENVLGLEPEVPMTGVWNGLRATTGVRSDIRFACRISEYSLGMDVDLSFYDTDWYSRITTGPADVDSCFYDVYSPPIAPPERRNNLTAELLPAGDTWNLGPFQGENTCDDELDFTVDFDNRGMDADEVDGTDWGEDDGFYKCATVGHLMTGGAWFIFVRD